MIHYFITSRLALLKLKLTVEQGTTAGKILKVIPKPYTSTHDLYLNKKA